MGEAGCDRCGGRGNLVELERVRVRIPRGIEEGARLRVEGKGGPLGPGRQGDLLLTVRVRPHPYFRRRGGDIHADLPITVAEAILGAELEVPTIDGPVRVKVPPGTSAGRVLRLKGRGLALGGATAGDHYCRLAIQVPERVDDTVRELLRRLPEVDPRRGLPKGRL
jgi:DnaJ-class molecular chaperone